MKKLKVIQYGMRHEHANGKMISLKKMTDTYELIGVVDDVDVKTPFLSWHEAVFADVPRISAEEALNYPGLDCMVVEVPNLELVPVGRMCAERGIPMHLDKPAGETLEPYQELLAICEEKHVPLQMGYMYRGNPALSFIRSLLKNNVIGKVFSVEMDMNHGYGSDHYQEYIGKFKGGLMHNLGCHLIDFVISAFGRPEDVIPLMRTAQGDAPHIKNNCLAILEYPGCFVKLHTCSRGHGVVDNRMWKFAGSNGIICVSPPERFDGKKVEVHLSLQRECGGYPMGEHVFCFPAMSDRYQPQLEELAKIIRGEMENPYTYAHDLLVHEVTLAASGYIPYKKA